VDIGSSRSSGSDITAEVKGWATGCARFWRRVLCRGVLCRRGTIIAGGLRRGLVRAFRRCGRRASLVAFDRLGDRGSASCSHLLRRRIRCLGRGLRCSAREILCRLRKSFGGRGVNRLDCANRIRHRDRQARANCRGERAAAGRERQRQGRRAHRRQRPRRASSAAYRVGRAWIGLTSFVQHRPSLCTFPRLPRNYACGYRKCARVRRCVRDVRRRASRSKHGRSAVAG
jgi:hypothetical protein